MSVIVKNMEMPKNCDTCWALDDYGDYPRCRITGEQRGYNFPVRERRMDNCPLIELPPHGRLGDLDELYKVANMADDFGADTLDMLKLIADTPTVIEGSET